MTVAGDPSAGRPPEPSHNHACSTCQTIEATTPDPAGRVKPIQSHLDPARREEASWEHREGGGRKNA